jgi:hypothetical protein
MSIVVLLATVILAGWEAAVATWESCLPGQELLEAASYTTPRTAKDNKHSNWLHTSIAANTTPQGSWEEKAATAATW